MSERDRALNAEKDTSVKYEQLLQEYDTQTCHLVFTVVTNSSTLLKSFLPL